jgi:hypothetical protein
MASNPQFAATPKVLVGQVTTANANRDGTGTPVTIGAGGASGSRIDVIIIKAVSTTTTDGMIRIFIHNGTTHYLITEVPVVGSTASATVPTFEEQIVFENGILLPTSSWTIRATTEKTETFNIVAIGGDF